MSENERQAGRPGRGVASPAAPPIPDGLDAVLVLLRHGETTFIAERRFQGRLETPLSPLGERQAELAAWRLAHPRVAPPLPIPPGPPQAIVHSPLLRTRQTAERVSASMAEAGVVVPPLTAEPGIAEIGQGEWEGLPQDEVMARYREVLLTWRRAPLAGHAPGGESLPDVQARVRPALASLLGQLGAGRPRGSLERSMVSGYYEAAPVETPWALLVGHDGVFKVVMLTLLGLPLDHFWNVSFSLAAISVVEIRAGRAVLKALNLAAHLGRLEAEADAASASREASGAF